MTDEKNNDEFESEILKIVKGEVEAPTFLLGFLTNKWQENHLVREGAHANAADATQQLAALKRRTVELDAVCKEYADDIREAYQEHLDRLKSDSEPAENSSKVTELRRAPDGSD